MKTTLRFVCLILLPVLVTCLSVTRQEMTRFGNENPKDLSDEMKMVDRMTRTEIGNDFEGDVVCHLCKAVAMIAYESIKTGQAIDQEVTNFCQSLTPSWLSGLCNVEGEIIIPIAKAVGSNPDDTCTNPKVGACFRQSSIPKRLPSFPSGVIVGGALRDKSSYGCGCFKYTCGCCARIDIQKLELNETACANFTYLPNEYGLSLTLTVGGMTLYNKTISARNPPPICAAIPYLKQEASACLQFKNLALNSSVFSGCVDVEVQVVGKVIFQEELGCFKIPLTLERGMKRMLPLYKEKKPFNPLKSYRWANKADEKAVPIRWRLGY